MSEQGAAILKKAATRLGMPQGAILEIGARTIARVGLPPWEAKVSAVQKKGRRRA